MSSAGCAAASGPVPEPRSAATPPMHAVMAANRSSPAASASGVAAAAVRREAGVTSATIAAIATIAGIVTTEETATTVETVTIGEIAITAAIVTIAAIAANGGRVRRLGSKGGRTTGIAVISATVPIRETAPIRASVWIRASVVRGRRPTSHAIRSSTTAMTPSTDDGARRT